MTRRGPYTRARSVTMRDRVRVVPCHPLHTTVAAQGLRGLVARIKDVSISEEVSVPFWRSHGNDCSSRKDLQITIRSEQPFPKS